MGCKQRWGEMPTPYVAMSISEPGSSREDRPSTHVALEQRGLEQRLDAFRGPLGVLGPFSKTYTAAPVNRLVTSTAPPSCPFSANQRGLSGTLRRRMMITSAGTIPKPSIHRHDVSYGSASRMTTDDDRAQQHADRFAVKMPKPATVRRSSSAGSRRGNDGDWVVQTNRNSKQEARDDQ